MTSTEGRPVVLHYLVDGAGQGIWFGERQARWLVDHGHAVRAATHEDRHVYRALDPDDVRELDALVRAQPECRECDFCRQVPTHWRVSVRPFTLYAGPPEARPARIEHTLTACDVCARYIEGNDKRGLIEYSVASNIEYARAQGGYLTSVVLTHPRWQLERAIRPMVREVVYGMFGHRRGRPERTEEAA